LTILLASPTLLSEQITTPGRRFRHSSRWKTGDKKRNTRQKAKIGGKKKRRGEVSRPSPQSPKGILG
jgi:hypothetical protein